MKKILGIIDALVLGSMAALSAKSWTNIAGFGWNLPMDFTFTADGYQNGEEVILKNSHLVETLQHCTHQNHTFLCMHLVP